MSSLRIMGAKQIKGGTSCCYGSTYGMTCNSAPPPPPVSDIHIIFWGGGYFISSMANAESKIPRRRVLPPAPPLPSRERWCLWRDTAPRGEGGRLFVHDQTSRVRFPSWLDLRPPRETTVAG